MAEKKQNNILSLDFINDNSKYPGSARAAMVANMTDEQNQEFLKHIRMDPEHIPNYEPVYLEELTRQYSQDYKRAITRVDQERFKKVNILTDYFDEAFDGEYWEEFWKSFLAPGYE